MSPPVVIKGERGFFMRAGPREIDRGSKERCDALKEKRYDTALSLRLLRTVASR